MSGDAHGIRRRLPSADTALSVVFFVIAGAFTARLMEYYLGGAGGPSLLAVQMVPAAIVVLVANDLRRGVFYPRVPLPVRLVLAFVYAAAALGAGAYLYAEFDAIRITRLGIWNNWDFLAGTAVVLLILEYTRRKYFPVFIVNLILIAYMLVGPVVPGMFNHPGLSVERATSALSLEMSTGVFERLPQLGLTLIGSFLLLLAALRAFGCIDSILSASTRLAARAPSLLPQAAVIGSLAVAAVSGSGAANAATTGSATIPMLQRANFPRVYAAAVETASSLGGQLMPPLMGISAFLMAEFMRVSYFDVVARGFGPALIYFAGLILSVFLLARRYRTSSVGLEATPLTWVDRSNLLAYLGSIAALIYLMGVLRWPAMMAAQNVFFVLVAVLVALALAEAAVNRDWQVATLGRPLLRMLETFATTTAELVILLSSLGILTAAFTVTGVPDKVGVLLMEVADIHLIVLVLVAFAFGYLIGMGLPVTPTYIVVAVVVTPFMVRAGVDPWVAHFFAFFVAVFGELSPPTSVTAAVTSRIAESSFLKTMTYAIGLCLPLMIMMAAVFTRPGLVVTPGAAQIPHFLLVLAGSLGAAVCLQSKLADTWRADWALRGLVAVAAALALFHPSMMLATGAALLVAAAVVLAVYRAREPAPAATAGAG